MSKTEATTERTARGASTMIVSFEDLAIIDGFNPREDYGDIEELADSIKENGVVQPLRGHKKADGKYYITDGHRRYRALEMLYKLGVDIRVPLISDIRDSEEQRLINTIVLNTGKRLNPVEEAEVVQRLMNYNYKPKEIAKKLGFNIRYINNLVELSAAPKKLKDMISENTVSATQALSVMRSEKDFAAATEIIEKAVQLKKSKPQTESKNKSTAKGKKGGGNAAVTAQDIAEATGKHNSLLHLKKVMQIGKKNSYDVKEDNRVLYDFANKLVNGLYNFEDLFNELYESGQYELFSEGNGQEEE